MTKKVLHVLPTAGQHWVGDGFPARTLFGYTGPLVDLVSPFLLFDYTGPWHFEPLAPGRRPRGVGQHPHRGFETVTLVYDGGVAHADSAGNQGVIGPGDVQWMTAASGILHEELHSEAFSQRGGRFEVVQLWVNLPASVKMSKPAYQPLLAAGIPTVDLPGDAGRVRVIAGQLGDVQGAARTFTELNVWDVALHAGAEVVLPAPHGHNTLVCVLSGAVHVGDRGALEHAQLAVLARGGEGVTLRAGEGAKLLLLSGVPIDEPVVGHGPFVMNSWEEIQQAADDFNAGRFGAL